MTIIVPVVGKEVLGRIVTGKAAYEDYVLKLFTNDRLPGLADTAASYTEPSGNGYSSKNLTSLNWTVVPGNPTVMVYPEQTFGFSGAAGFIYGYFLVQATSGILVMAERFDLNPMPNIQNIGDDVKVTPRIELT